MFTGDQEQITVFILPPKPNHMWTSSLVGVVPSMT